MARALHQNIGDNGGLRCVLELQPLCGHEHEVVVSIKDRTPFDIARNSDIVNADAVHLDGQLNRNVSVAQFARNRKHRPTPRAVTNQNDSGAGLYFLMGKRASVRREVRKNPIEARGRIVRQKGSGADIPVRWFPQSVSDLHNARRFVIGSFHCAHEPCIDDLAARRIGRFVDNRAALRSHL